MYLPPELYEEVLWYIALEKRRDPLAIPFEFSTTPKNSTLNQCMLVNRHFAEIARGHVFASISVNQFEPDVSLRWMANILAGESEGRIAVPSLVPAGRLVQSFVVKISPQNLIPTRVALLTRVALIVQRSPKLVTLGLLNTNPAHYNFATLRAYAAPLLDALLHLCLLPHLRHLSLTGLKSVPARIAFNPNLESLNLQSVILDDPTPDVLGGPKDVGPVTASAAPPHWQSSLPALKTLSFSRFKGNWNRLIPPEATSDFVDFAEAFLSQTPQPERERIEEPLFPHLITLIWTLSRAGQLYSAGLATAFIQKHAPNLKYLILYSHFYNGFPPPPDLGELRQLEALELIVTFAPKHGAATEMIARCIDWTTQAIAAAGPTLTSFSLHLDFFLDFFLDYALNNTTENPLHPWMTHSLHLLDLWVRLREEIARCPAKDVQIHIDVRFRSGERFAPPVDFQKVFRSQTCAKLGEVFIPLWTTKDYYEYVPHQFGTHYQRLRTAIPF